MAVAKEYIFAWKVENYYLRYISGKELKSPVFIPKDFGGTKWYLMLKPYTMPNEFCIFLCRNDDDLGDDVITISFEIDIKSVDGRTVVARGNRCMQSDFKRGSLSDGSIHASVEAIHEANLNWDKEIIIITCHMFLSAQRIPRFEAVTNVGIKTLSFEIKIKLSKEVQSRVFSISEMAQYEIAVNTPSNAVQIKIKRLKVKSKTPTALCGKVSLLNKEGDVDLSLKSGFLFRNAGVKELWILPPFIIKDEIEREESIYLDHGLISILCEFSEPNGDDHSEVLKCDSHFTDKLKNILTLQSDFEELFSFTDEKHSDIKLQTEDAVLFVHKYVLIARSPVFRGMFEHDMSEERKGVIEIVDVDTETLKTFLKFLYSGTVDMTDDEDAMKLLMVANKYQVSTLIKTASAFLASTLSPEVACKVLYLADMADLEDLKKTALHYVVKHAVDISKTHGWAKYIRKNVRLCSEISEHLIKNMELKKKKKWLGKRCCNYHSKK